MKNSKNTKSVTAVQILPYLYGRQSDPGVTSNEQRSGLFPPPTESAPELEELKANDPDSYRMVIYSWG